MNNTLEEKLNTIQNTLRTKIDLKNKFQLDEINLVAGVDIAYWSDNDVDYGVCCIKVLHYLTKENH